MKRFVKICLIAGSICVLIGGGILAVSAVLGGNLWDTLPPEVVEWGKEISGIDVDDLRIEKNFDDFYLMDNLNQEEKGQEIFSSPEVKKLDIIIPAGTVVFVEDPQENEVKIFCNQDQTRRY